MKYVKGNLLDMFDNHDFNVIIHGCNCFRAMGAGIAGQIATRYPLAKEADDRTIRGDSNKLGTYSLAHLEDGRIIVNLYSQFHPGFCHPDILYPSIDSGFYSILTSPWFTKDMRIGIPMIGSGIANGDWDVIQDIILSCQEETCADITVVEYVK